MKFSRAGLTVIALLLAVLGGLGAYPRLQLAESEGLLTEADPDVVMDALGRIAAIPGDRPLDVLIRTMETHPDRKVADWAATMILFRNRMMPSHPRPKDEEGRLVPMHHVDGASIVFVFEASVGESLRSRYREWAAARFGLPVAEQPFDFLFDDAYEPSRGQYNFELMIRTVLARLGRRHGRFVVVVDRDTFYPGRNWGTGCSLGMGPVAILSTPRLRPDFGDPERDDARWRARLEKVMTHELGHTLMPTDRHCPNGGCVLHATNSLGDIDRLPLTFCTSCGALVGRSLRDLKQAAAATTEGVRSEAY